MYRAIIFSSVPSLSILQTVASDLSKVIFKREIGLGVKNVIYGRCLCHLVMGLSSLSNR